MRLQRQNLFIGSTLSYRGETYRDTMYTSYINHHAGTPSKTKQNARNEPQFITLGLKSDGCQHFSIFIRCQASYYYSYILTWQETRFCFLIPCTPARAEVMGSILTKVENFCSFFRNGKRGNVSK